MKIIKAIFILLLLSNISFSIAQENSLFPLKYFNHKAQNKAVITAKYAELAFAYSRDAILDERRFNLHLDTALYFVNKALLSVDSTRKATTDSLTRDSSRIAMIYIKKSELNLLKARAYLKVAHDSKGYYKAAEFTEKAIFSCGSAIADAYTCSLYFIGAPENDQQNINDCDCPCENDQIASNNSTSLTDQKQTLTDNQAKRLEVDEATLTSIKAMYEQRLADMQRQIDELKAALANATSDSERQSLQSQIDQIEGNKSMLSNKRDGAENKLKGVRTELDQYYAENGQLANSSSRDKPMFAFDRDGFYNEANPIPVDRPVVDGLIYSIQLGVYSKKATPSIFLGLYPLESETVAGDKFKYRTGIFYSYSQAAEAKNDIWGIGLKDAFIIAYQNGKPISVSQALRLEGK